MSEGRRALGALLRRPGIAAWMILVVALALRVGVVAATPGYEPLNDPADYNRHAVSIAAGDWYPDTQLAKEGSPTAFRPPLYPFFLATVYAVSDDSWTAGRLAQALLGTIGVALIGIIAWQLWGRRIALPAMGLAAVAPPLLLPGAALLAEPLFIALELGAVAAVLEHRRSPARFRWAALAGALAGLALLARTSGLVMLLPLAVGVWTLRPWFSWRAVAAPAVLVLAAALVVVPWTIRNLVVMDEFVPVSTQTGFTLAVTYNDAARLDPDQPSVPHYVSEYTPLLERGDLDEVELESKLGSRARDYMLEHPGYVVQTGWRNMIKALHLDGLGTARDSAAPIDVPRWLADLGTIGFYVIAALALVGAFLPPARRAPLFLWAIPVLLVSSAVIISAKTRYRIVADPFLILLAAVAVATAWERLTIRTRASR